ncbi:MAG: hypothetical protein LBM98_05410 [Oscillospiraceae bacterium]|nr:hypothetical protein [Oscillospiraceae bacterium]
MADVLLSETRENGFIVRTYREALTDGERQSRDSAALRKLKKLLLETGKKEPPALENHAPGAP